MRPRSEKRRSFRPRVEALESRVLLSVCTVDRLTDLGEGSGMAGDLRYCITQAQDGDSIQFEVTGTINLTEVLPTLTRNISIEGPGAHRLTIRRSTTAQYRIFTFASSATSSLSGLTLANGGVFGGEGGAIHNAGTLTLTNSSVADSTARTGGGIYNSGTLTVAGSTISGNSAADPTSAAGGGFFNTGTLIIVDSTISGNQASAVGLRSANGGGIINSGGTLIVLNSSITLNRAGPGPASSGGGIAGGGSRHLRNSILAGNTAPNGPDLSGALTSSGFNLVGNSRGGSGYDPTDLLDIDPLLGPLQDNGGPTHTHALLPASPAINAGDPAFEPPPDTDQRGFNRIVGERIDIGAFEVQPPATYFYIWPDSDAVVAGFPFDVYLLALHAEFNLVPDFAGEVASGAPMRPRCCRRLTPPTIRRRRGVLLRGGDAEHGRRAVCHRFRYGQLHDLRLRRLRGARGRSGWRRSGIRVRSVCHRSAARRTQGLRALKWVAVPLGRHIGP
jgi:hypothetical protein